LKIANRKFPFGNLVMAQSLFTVTVALFLLASCSTTFSMYSRDVFLGKKLYRQQEYGEAKELFEKAARIHRDALTLTYLAMIHYKMNDLEAAERTLGEAERLGGNTEYYLRIVGYRALIRAKKDLKEGPEALKGYVDTYRYYYPLNTIKDLEKMVRTRQIDTDKLERLIEEQVSRYEEDVELYRTHGIGYFDRGRGDWHD
jgi:tetratricopeptide (TPR) repeat protein